MLRTRALAPMPELDPNSTTHALRQRLGHAHINFSESVFSPIKLMAKKKENFKSLNAKYDIFKL